MTLPVVWRVSARADMAVLIHFIADENPFAAKELRRRIEASVLSLSDFPYMGRPGRAPGTRELLPHPNYCVVYEVSAANVDIIAVVHSRQEYP